LSASSLVMFGIYALDGLGFFTFHTMKERTTSKVSVYRRAVSNKTKFGKGSGQL